MAQIRLLSEQIAQKIAAGEVVERPASVIKELVENSIDAGSTFITVEIKEGGIRSIRVTDNGCGIAADEVKLAFLRHATSKIYELDDLYRIQQMGFRGEALYSIAAVSRLEIITKPAAQAYGRRMMIEGGKITKLEDYGCPDGTSITVNDLFFNTPARLKFLSSPNTEAAAISSILAKLILGNPGISIKFIHNQRVIYHSAGDGNLQNTVYAVYGRDIAAGMLPVEECAGEYAVYGLIGKADNTRSSRAQQVLLVNRRPVNHFPFSRMIEDLYGGALPAKRYPVFVLNIMLPPAQVDVNVHPNKLQVRFSDERRLRGILQSAVSKTLGLQESQAIALEIPETPLPDRGQNKTEVFQPRPISTSPVVSPENTPSRASQARAKVEEPGQNESVATFHPLHDAPRPEHAPDAPTMEQSVEQMRNILKSAIVGSDPHQTHLEIWRTLAQTPVLREAATIPNTATEQTRILDEAPPKILGQLFDAYILIETPQGLYIIDQHAAHERLLYDRLLQRMSDKKTCSQNLLIPQTIDLSYEEFEVLEANLPLFEELGFVCEAYGRLCYQIRAVPFVLGQPQVESFFRDILYMLLRDKTVSNAQLKKEKLMSMACRKAVKAGDKLSDENLKELLHIVAQEKTPLTCPHGRPFVLLMEKANIDRHFKRIK